jgi:ferredoxin
MEKPYKQLAERLDSLPNGFPPTESGVELRLLKKLFSLEEAELASKLRLTKETSAQITGRTGGDLKEVRKLLKQMVKRGLISFGKVEGGLGFGLMPFVVGIYEMQVGRIDAEFAALFEEYYQQSFGQTLAVEPQVHRVVPVGETVRVDMEVRPYESAADIVSGSKSWGVVECICRTQQALIGDPCLHPRDVCMVLSEQPGAFDRNTGIRKLTMEGSLDTLKRASQAGLVHTVSNNQEGHWYICNCCSCSCGFLRGIAELGIANDEDLCLACEICMDYCNFDALEMNDVILVDEVRCVGCGLCVTACPEEALTLVRRPEEEVFGVPVTEEDWWEERAMATDRDLKEVL